MDLGVYITLRDDDKYIADCIRPVMEVFPQVKVIDLASQDESVARIKETGADLYIHSFTEGRKPGEEFTELKSFFSAKHDWVIWVDSDEIYTVESLLKLKELVQARQVSGPQTVRCSWKFLKEEDGKLFVAKNLKLNGHKAFNSKLYKFNRAWPNETLIGDEVNKEPLEYNGVWCWHAVLLERSSLGSTGQRRKKKEGKLEEYKNDFEWEEVKELPWKQL